MHGFPLRWLVLAVFLTTAAYVHRRGRLRFKLTRQLTDHSTFFAPVNTLIYLSSSVPPHPWLDPAQFPELATLQAHWREIRDECLALADEGGIRASDGYNDVGFNSFFRTGWKRFYLMWYGTPHASARERCPKTVALLESIPAIKAAMFASLPPGAHLVKHRDPYAGSLRYHLGLATPNSDDCYIEVDGERRSWRDGRALMFDETFIHHARNDTQQQRLILFCDVQRPLSNPIARAIDVAFRQIMMRAAATENVPGERIGWLNRVFGVAYRVRLLGKALKVRSRFAYYALKYLSIIAALAWIVS